MATPPGPPPPGPSGGLESIGWKGWYTAGVVALAFALLMRGKAGPDVVMVGALGMITAAGVLSPSEAIIGFANEGVLTVAVLFIVAAGVSETGTLDHALGKLLGNPASIAMAQMRMCIPIAFASAFLNNTPVVAIMIPIVKTWAQRINMPITQMLIPLSFASMLGGTCTLIGTSTNLIVAGMARDYFDAQGMLDREFHLFSLTKYGVPVMIVGVVYIVLASPHLLPKDEKPGAPSRKNLFDATDFLLRAFVPAGSRADGETVEQAGLRGLDTLYLVSVRRGDTLHRAVGPHFTLAAKDILHFAGITKGWFEVCRQCGLEPITEQWKGGTPTGSNKSIQHMNLDKQEIERLMSVSLDSIIDELSYQEDGGGAFSPMPMPDNMRAHLSIDKPVSVIASPASLQNLRHSSLQQLVRRGRPSADGGRQGSALSRIASSGRARPHSHRLLIPGPTSHKVKETIISGNDEPLGIPLAHKSVDLTADFSHHDILDHSRSSVEPPASTRSTGPAAPGDHGGNRRPEHVSFDLDRPSRPAVSAFDISPASDDEGDFDARGAGRGPGSTWGGAEIKTTWSPANILKSKFPSSFRSALKKGLQTRPATFVMFGGRRHIVSREPDLELVTPEAEPLDTPPALQGAGLRRQSRDSGAATFIPSGQLVQATVREEGRLVGTTPRQVKFRSRYGAALLAIVPKALEGRRASDAGSDGVTHSGAPLKDNLGDAVLHGGDQLLLDIGDEFEATEEVKRDLDWEHLEVEEAKREFVIGMEVEAGGKLVGITAEDNGLVSLPGLRLVRVERSGTVYADTGGLAGMILQDGDVLWFAGVLEGVVGLRKVPGLAVHNVKLDKLKVEAAERRLVECVVAIHSPMVGKTIRDVRFRSYYDAAIIAVHRRGLRVDKKIGDIVLEAGDVLLLDTGPLFVAKFKDDVSFALVSELENSAPALFDKVGIACVTVTAMVVVSSTGITDLLTAGIFAAGVMILAGCITQEKARQAVKWQVLVTIAAAFGLSRAMEKTHVAANIAEGLVSLGKATGAGKYAVLTSIYLATVILSNIIANNAAAALMFPVAIRAAIDPDTGITDIDQVIYLLMLAASAAYASPFGYQTNLMVFGAGGYVFKDFLLFGGVMHVVQLVATIAIVVGYASNAAYVWLGIVVLLWAATAWYFGTRWLAPRLERWRESRADAAPVRRRLPLTSPGRLNVNVDGGSKALSHEAVRVDIVANV